MKNSKINYVESKRFVVSKSRIGKGIKLKVTFKNGDTYAYDHDKAVELMNKATKLKSLPCWEKYGSYTSSSSIPKSVREIAEKL